MVSGPNDAQLRERAKKVIPNGMYGHQSTRLLPANFPQWFSRAEGAYLWDVDGNRYLDLMCGYGTNLFGYRDERVDEAVATQLAVADNMTGPSPLMVDLAEQFVSMVSHAEWAMFCKNGTDATTMAVTVARAETKRRHVIVAEYAYHGSAPWCTPIPAGVVPEQRAHISSCVYNDVDSLDEAVAAAGDDLAAVVVAPFKHDAFQDQALPDPDYARRARELCDVSGAMLIVDDVRAGLRVSKDCSWESLGVRPDMSTWGKTIGNGHPISALLGSESCRRGAGDIYATGSYWFSAGPMAAALETLRLVRETDYLEHTVALGKQLRIGLDDAAGRYGFSLHQSGPVQMPQIFFQGDDDFRLGFAWAEAMSAERVYVHPWHNMFFCDAMTSEDIDFALAAADRAFGVVGGTLDSIEPHPVVKTLVGGT